MHGVQIVLGWAPDVALHLLPIHLKQTVKGGTMIHTALVLLVIGLIAGILGLTGAASVFLNIGWVLFVVGLVLLLIHLFARPHGRAV